jgi:hypothetical protein
VPPDFTTSGDAQIEITGFRENGVLNTLIAGSIAARRAVYTKDIDLADVISRRGGSGNLTESSGSSSDSFFGVPKLDISIEGRDALVVRNNVADLTRFAQFARHGRHGFSAGFRQSNGDKRNGFFRSDRYEVQRAVVEFPPNTNIEPYINLQAETEIRGYQIVVNLAGRMTNTENLSATVRSKPGAAASRCRFIDYDRKSGEQRFGNSDFGAGRHQHGGGTFDRCAD